MFSEVSAFCCCFLLVVRSVFAGGGAPCGALFPKLGYPCLPCNCSFSEQRSARVMYARHHNSLVTSGTLLRHRAGGKAAPLGNCSTVSISFRLSVHRLHSYSVRYIQRGRDDAQATIRNAPVRRRVVNFISWHMLMCSFQNFCWLCTTGSSLLGALLLLPRKEPAPCKQDAALSLRRCSQLLRGFLLTFLTPSYSCHLSCLQRRGTQQEDCCCSQTRRGKLSHHCLAKPVSLFPLFLAIMYDGH